MTNSHDAEHFRRIYARSADPWAYQTSDYEQEKYQRTLVTLGERRFKSGFEPGCSIGVLTRLLATRCDALLAADIVEEPLQTARKLCADLPWVRFTRLRIPDEWPGGHFDLIVLSEVLYFLTPADIARLSGRVRDALDYDGVVLSVNWLGHGDDPCGGDEAAAIFLNEMQTGLSINSHYHSSSYRIDMLIRR